MAAAALGSSVLRARVVSVTPRSDGTYAVTLSTGTSNVLWFRADRPVRRGDIVEVLAEGAVRTPLARGRLQGTLTLLQGGRLRVVSEQQGRRVVAAEWLERVQRVARRPLFSYQAEGAAWIAQRLASGTGAILADEPGLGKTIQTIAALYAVGAVPFLVVCPASAKVSWQREARYLRRPLNVHNLEHRQGPIPACHGLVLNYELLRHREQQLGALGARAIVFDESHAVKEPEPHEEHRAAVATRLSARIGRAVMITGSPLLNRPAELWRLLHLADAPRWPDFASFRARYCRKPAEDDVTMGRELVTSHGEVYNLDELRALADRLVLRRRKRDLLAKLPPKHRRSVLVELEPADRHHYQAAERNVVAWLRQVVSHFKARSAARNEQLVRLTMLRHIAAVAKLRRAAPEYLEAWYTGERAPLVIFAFHQDVVTGLHAICQRLGLRRSGITSKMQSAQRQAEIDRFTVGSADVFIAPLGCAGQAINLQSACNALVLERLWTPSLMSQAEDRLHRLGQDRPVTVTYLDARHTVDQYVAEVLEAKQRLIDTVVDDVRKQDEKTETVETLDKVVDRMAAG